MLGIGRTKLWHLTRTGDLKSANIGRRVVYLADDLSAFLAKLRQ